MKTHLLSSRKGLLINPVNSLISLNKVTGIMKIVFSVLILFSNATSLSSVPSYARQLGISCSICHYSFPELTPFGRQFKLSGYTMTGMPTIEAKTDSNKVVRLNLLSFLPLSAMVQSSLTYIAKNVPGKQNYSVDFPQQLSVFYAAQVTPHIGTFIQMTYDGQTFGMDNADIRFTNTVNIGSKSLLYGLTLNNNPAVQDVWNTSPAWRFPSAISNAAINPSKLPVISQLGMQVAGLGAYSLYNNLLFTEVTFYRSAQQGAANPADSTSMMALKGVAPYWRVALQHQWSDNYISLGTFGIATRHYITGISGLINNFTDIGVDFQYEHNLANSSFTLHTSFINERERRDTSLNRSQYYRFNSFKIDGNLYLKGGIGATVGYFSNWGTSDKLVGSFNNKPDSNGFIFQLEFLPWYNTKFTIQYFAYNMFDGRRQNYDGFGRNAASNNTLYILAWLNF